MKKLNTKTEEFCDEAVEDDHYLTGVNWQIVKDECQLELATKYNKKYKIKGTVEMVELNDTLPNIKTNLLEVTAIDVDDVIVEMRQMYLLKMKKAYWHRFE